MPTSTSGFFFLPSGLFLLADDDVALAVAELEVEAEVEVVVLGVGFRGVSGHCTGREKGFP